MSTETIAADGLLPEHVGRRVTVLVPSGLTGQLTAWRLTPHDRKWAGIAHLTTDDGVDHHVRVQRRRRIRLHEQENPA